MFSWLDIPTWLTKSFRTSEEFSFRNGSRNADPDFHL